MTNVTGQRIEPTVEAASPLTEIRDMEKVYRAGKLEYAAVDLAIWPGGHGDGGRPVRLFA